MSFVLCILTFILHISISLFFFKQKTSYEMRISDWSSDVCSSDLRGHGLEGKFRLTDPAAKKLLSVLRGEKQDVPPVWLMRQAGRYLPEYRELRAEKGGCLELVYDSKAAAEITLQPLRRFGFDGSILFSDILIVPYALGQAIWFEAGEGPRLAPTLQAADLAALMLRKEKLEPI